MTITAVFPAILACIKAIPIIDSWFQQFLAWYMMSHTAETKHQIVDAAAFAARATTDEERYAASEKWRATLSRTRELSN